jgi:transcriptional regulator with XRE-family HTH domain
VRQWGTMTHMSEMTDTVTVPQLTLGWRLQMSLANSPYSRAVIAEALGVDASTVGRWMNDKGSRPKRAYLAQWSLMTGVPFEWLDTGQLINPDGPSITGGFWTETSSSAGNAEAATDCGNLLVFPRERAA